jgi:hypothetical protein
VIYPLLPPEACVALNGAITDPAANSEKGALSFCALCQGAPPCRDYEKTGGDLFACLDDGQTTGQAPTKYELIINTRTTKGLGPHHPTNTSRARRRGHRIAALMSPIGTFQTCRLHWAMSAFEKGRSRCRRRALRYFDINQPREHVGILLHLVNRNIRCRAVFTTP